MIFYTIGVYGSSEQEFFKKITDNKIDTFCDIRQRRGVRGAKYAFVNSKRLQQQLSELKIRYVHILNLAPTCYIRNFQKEIDNKKGELKRNRKELSSIFRIEYENMVLQNFDFELFFSKLDEINASKIAFFCVEEKPESCHRSIVTKYLHDKYNKQINHL